MNTPARWFKTLGGRAFALLTLVIVLGGSGALAAATTGSNDIADNAIKSRHIDNGQVKSADVEQNTLTGADIKEATLADAPQAISWDVPVIWYTADGNPPWQDVVQAGTLRMQARCFGIPNGTSLQMRLISTVSAAYNYSFSVDDPNDPFAPFTLQDGDSLEADEPSTQFGLYPDNDGGFTEVRRGEGQLIYESAGSLVSITLHGVANGLTERCQLAGVATPAPR